MARRYLAAAGAAVLATVCGLCGQSPVAAASGGTQGVTATTIRVGVPYVDVAATKAVGVDINWGNVPDAYMSVIGTINAHGGINGRRIVPYILAVDPTSPAPAATACTEMVQDNKVFAVIAPLQPACYLQSGVPVVGGITPVPINSGVAQNFSLAPPTNVYDKLQLTVYAKQGIFKNKKVGIFAGATTDEPEIPVVQSILKKLKVSVVATAIDSAPQQDLPASDAQVETIAQRFQADGVNEVVAVGYGSAIWPNGLSASQSSYNPQWIATSEADLSGDVGGSNNPIYLKNVVTSSPLTSPAEIWTNAQTQKCVSQVRKDYPSDHINTYSASAPSSQVTWTGIEQACTDVGLFATIAKAAGKHLTVSSFVHAGYGLRNVTIPGQGAPISFGPNQPYALGPVFRVHYDSTTKTLNWASKSSA
jgi:ABC-type branched-subunit amino acid transport system substrate-binding protein